MTEIEMWVTERDGTKIAPLPEANLETITWELNKEGSASLKIDPLSRGARQIEGIRTEIQFWLDGDLEQWTVPWGLNGKSAEITVTTEGLFSLFNKRFVDRMSMLYTSIDQVLIAWDLINYAQSESVEANRDLNIDAVSPLVPSGVPRSRNYKREEHKCILDLILEFDRMKLNGGFDFEIAFTEDGARFYKPYYPMKGEPKPNFAIEWDSEGERNISDFTWGENFLPLITLAYATGGTVTAGGISIKKEGKYEDVDASAYWGQMQGIVSEGSQLDEDWLDDRAQQIVETKSMPEVVTQITSAIDVDRNAVKGLQVGDWIPVRIDHGRIQVQNWQRISKKVYKASSDTVDLSFGEEVVVP